MFPRKLERAILKHHGGIELFKQDVRDICLHGISAGFSNWIYFSDFFPFFHKNKKEIFLVLAELADDMGKSIAELLDCTEKELMELILSRPKELSSNFNAIISNAVYIIVEKFADDFLMKLEIEEERKKEKIKKDILNV